MLLRRGVVGVTARHVELRGDRFAGEFGHGHATAGGLLTHARVVGLGEDERGPMDAHAFRLMRCILDGCAARPKREVRDAPVTAAVASERGLLVRVLRFAAGLVIVRSAIAAARRI
jgi:hypothetical protein